MFPNAKILALTATATTKMQNEIRKQLGMKSALTVQSSMNRPNIKLSLVKRPAGCGGKNTVQESYDFIYQPLVDELRADKSSFERTIVYSKINWCGYGYEEVLVAVFGGFAACVVIGLLFVLCMPLAGCITCCCYCCCKKCGKASSKEDPKNAKCKRVTFGSFLFIFTVLILVGAIFSVISNEILHSKLENVNDHGPIGQVKSSLDGLVSFAGDTADEIVQSSEKTVIDTVKDLLKIIKGASEQTVEDIQNSINATELLNQVESLGENANISAESLTVVTKEVTALKDLGIKTTQKLTDVKDNITAICNGVPNCANTSGLNLATDFSQLDDLGNIGVIVQAVTDISKKAGKAREEFNGIKNKIQTELLGTITEAEKKTNQTRDDILKEIPSIKDTLNNIVRVIA
ncbi:unnamed protein product [Mytilus edulis]|uniref:Prominin-like protein n=1 Tax=Mytilus edulis TaxID=6550 RepID=A0A8S3Q8H3_MYTED|nr:unnamed protein product [Mytilus edulis]